MSLAFALSVIVWRRFAPGSLRAEVGALSLEDVATARLPALSRTL